MNNLDRVLRVALCALWCGCWNTAAAASTEAPGFKLPPHRVVRLENGMTLMLMERHTVPLVSVQWLLPSGGSVNDPDGQEGLAGLTARMLRKGTTARSADQISAEIDFVGGRLDAAGALEFSGGTGQFRSKDLGLALQLTADMLRHPIFPADELEKLTQQDIDGIKQDKMTPQGVIGRYFSGLLMAGHPYANPVSGTETSLAKIGRDDVLSFHRKQYVPSGLVLAIVGAISADETERRVRELFQDWTGEPPARPALPRPARVSGRQILLVEKPDSTQTFFRLGDVGLERSNPAWIAVEVVNTLFGGRFTSQLNTALRIESGLTYGARSGFSETTLPGEFALASYTQNEKTATALKLTLQVLRNLHTTGLSEEQLRSAKTYIKGQFGPQFETHAQLAAALCEIQFHHLGPDYYDRYFERVDAVTPEDVQRAIRYFAGDNFRMVMIGQAGAMEPIARELNATIARKNIADPGF